MEEWIKQQAVALEVLKSTMLPFQQESNLLQVPAVHGQPPAAEQHLPRSLVKMFSTNEMLSPGGAPGPLKAATLWRRSRSESDVSAPQHDLTSFVCEHCGQVSTPAGPRDAVDEHGLFMVFKTDPFNQYCLRS